MPRILDEIKILDPYTEMGHPSYPSGYVIEHLGPS